MPAIRACLTCSLDLTGVLWDDAGICTRVLYASLLFVFLHCFLSSSVSTILPRTLQNLMQVLAGKAVQCTHQPR